jgi:hypothetical protein
LVLAELGLLTPSETMVVFLVGTLMQLVVAQQYNPLAVVVVPPHTEAQIPVRPVVVAAVVLLLFLQAALAIRQAHLLLRVIMAALMFTLVRLALAEAVRAQLEAYLLRP